ncbi:hypothetical protein ACIBX9_21980 [Streptomyces albidoflavus]|uniref:hypothetical protein n=1 Tax=Streptomyces sp. SM8 TaxID=1195457 RepID=UPI000282FB56|nr:hypothetical protein [Streptomyces sp. SM8]PKA35749.1 hypothetical protein SM8_016855 [Streptomyces sp. SM8]WTD04110.1 hypothetical protein OH717_16870 [Streptomyces albidoflavus]
MADLTPTPDRPGLHVSKPSPSAPATASAVCHCGATATATGDDQVRALVEGYTNHHGPAHHRKSR